MHKKFFVLVVAIALVTVGMGFGQNQTKFNFSVVVDPYIEVLVPVQDMAVSPYHVKGPAFAGMVATYTGLSGGSWPGGIGDLAYVNCPFSVTIEGDNPAGDGKPIYAREEVDGTGAGLNRYDRLNTQWQIRLHTDYRPQLDIVFAKAETAPWTYTANEAPHNGWVGIDFMCYGHRVDGPAAKIDRNQAYDQSPDAGVYTCFLVITLTAL